jgi:TonB family protein
MATRGSGGGYFALLVQPEGAQTHPRVVAKEMVFVIDTSGSMTGFPLAAEKRFMRQALQSMNPDDTFMLIDFADHASSFHGSPLPNTPRNVERALAYLDALPAGGGTNQLDGIRTALDRPDDQARLRTVLFMTDGFIGNDNEILAETQKLLGNARLFSFGVGTSVNHYLLSRLGEVGRGFYQYVRPDEDKAEAIERFLRRIARPLVTDVEIDWGGLTVSEVLPRKIPDLFDNQPFIVVGKYSAPGRARVVVHGKTAGVSRTTEADVELPERSDEHAAIATLWARARIEELERLQYAGEKAELIRQITSLGLEHRLVTPYTSFVAVDQVVAASPNSLLHTVNEAVEMPDQVTMGEPAVKAPPAKHEAKVTGQGHDTWTGDKPRSGGYHAAPVNTPQPGYVADPGAVSGIGGIDTSGEAKTTRSGHADDDFDKIFGSGGGGGGTQGAQPASQPRTSEKAKTVYIPPAPGWGDHANNGDLGVDGKASKERDSKVGGLIALREGLDEHKANAEIVGGAIDRTTIENVIKAHLPELQASYENSLKSNPHAGGQVVVELTIAATGLVSNAEIVSSTLRAPEVERAILKSARTWKFPAPGGGAVIVRYPFDFTPGALKDTFAESDVMEVVLAAKPALKKCIAEQKAREPAKSGTIVMRWTIKNDGTVTNVQTVTEPFQKAPLSACLESLIKGLRFYPYSGPLMSPIDFPFKF